MDTRGSLGVLATSLTPVSVRQLASKEWMEGDKVLHPVSFLGLCACVGVHTSVHTCDAHTAHILTHKEVWNFCGGFCCLDFLLLFGWLLFFFETDC